MVKALIMKMCGMVSKKEIISFLIGILVYFMEKLFTGLTGDVEKYVLQAENGNFKSNEAKLSYVKNEVAKKTQDAPQMIVNLLIEATVANMKSIKLVQLVSKAI